MIKLLQFTLPWLKQVCCLHVSQELTFFPEFLYMFLAYKTLVEKQFGQQLQRLRTYDGGEYVNNKFIGYYIAQGIYMHHIVPHTP